MVRIFVIVLILLLALLQYRLWFGEGSVRSIVKLKHQVAKQQAVNKKLAQRNKVLSAEVLDLKSGHLAVEERARNELGMVKKGETFYQIVK